MSAEEYRVGADLGAPGGDKTAHTLTHVTRAGTLVVDAVVVHEPGVACDLCELEKLKQSGFAP